MVRLNVIRNVPINIGTPIVGVNENGTMALCWGVRGVYGRGIRSDGTSCIFRGSLHDMDLRIDDIVLSPEMRPTTEGGKVICGFEDPSWLDPWHNKNILGIDDRDTDGILCTEAFYKQGKSGPVGTNLVYVDSIGNVKTVLTPEDVEARLGRIYKDVDMVKEANIDVNVAYVEWPNLLIEVGAAGHSRIVVCADVPNPQGRFVPFLEPVSGTWFDHHVSTAADTMRLGHGISLLVFNGAKLVESGGRQTNRWAVGLGLLNENSQLFWWTSEPIITPPDGIEPGPVGQLIAFGSDAMVSEREGKRVLSILYHAMDRFPCLYEAEITFGLQ